MYELRDLGSNKGLYYNNKFCGIYSEILGNINMFSGHNNQIFDAEICAIFLLEKHKKVFSRIRHVGSQKNLEVTINPYTISEGVWKEHTK